MIEHRQDRRRARRPAVETVAPQPVVGQDDPAERQADQQLEAVPLPPVMRDGDQRQDRDRQEQEREGGRPEQVRDRTRRPARPERDGGDGLGGATRRRQQDERDQSGHPSPDDPRRQRDRPPHPPGRGEGGDRLDDLVRQSQILPSRRVPLVLGIRPAWRKGEREGSCEATRSPLGGKPHQPRAETTVASRVAPVYGLNPPRIGKVQIIVRHRRVVVSNFSLREEKKQTGCQRPRSARTSAQPLF